MGGVQDLARRVRLFVGDERRDQRVCEEEAYGLGMIRWFRPWFLKAIFTVQIRVFVHISSLHHHLLPSFLVKKENYVNYSMAFV